MIELCRELASLLPPSLQKVMLLNTGSESNEAALRIAKLKTGRFEIVGLTRSFHGLTGGAGSSTYAAGSKGYGPSSPGTLAIPAPDCYRCPIRHCVDRCDMTCLEAGFEMIDAQTVGSLAAFIAEPIISSGGMILPPPGYFPRLKQLCEARGMLLILDEAQTGLGRCGANFAFEQDGAVPDILTLSKTLGGRVAAIGHGHERRNRGNLLSERLPASDLPPVRSPSRGRGPGRAEVLVREKLAERASRMGEILKSGLEEIKDRYVQVGDVRGRTVLGCRNREGP